MPSHSCKAPAYRLHKPSNRAVVRLDGRDIYLGKYDSPESRDNYRRIVGEWMASGGVVRPPAKDEILNTGPSVAELALAFLKHAQDHYHRAADGSPSGEVENFKAAIRPLRDIYAMLPAQDFSPLKLQAVREQMIKADLTRTTINSRVNRIRHLFKWGVSREMVPGSVLESLKAVTGLQKGRTQAREPEPVKPVPIADVEKTLPFLTRPVAGLVRFQLYTGCRPGEACMVRGCDIGRDETPWMYIPLTHKNAHRGQHRIIPLGPKARAMLADYLKADPNAYLFDPAEGVQLNRKAGPMSRSALAKREKAKKGKVRTAVAESRRYRRAAYIHAITRACKKAGVPAWHPNQLRHTFATQVRARFGLEAAQAILGHSKADTTQIYAERDLGKARSVIQEIG